MAVGVGPAYDELKSELFKQAGKLRVGYGLDEITQMGIVVSHIAKERIERMISEGIAQGAEPILDGRNLTVPGFEDGSFVGPTILADVTSENIVAREEIFWPVLSLMKSSSFRRSSRISEFKPLWQRSKHFHYKWQIRQGIQVSGKGRQHWCEYRCSCTFRFLFGGQKETFFGDLHGQGSASIEFFTKRKVVIERWA